MATKQEAAPAPYHTMIRYLSAQDYPESNWYTPQTVAEHLRAWTDKGYELFSASYTTSIMNDRRERVAEGVLYVLKYVG